MPYNHAWAGRPFWARDDVQLCKRCGAEFHRYNVRQIYCNPACRYARLTPDEKTTMARYLALCQKYDLAKAETFEMLAQEHWTILRELTIGYSPNHKGGVSEMRKSRIMRVVKRFCDDMERGFYDIVRFSDHRDAKNRAVRRESAGKIECPRRAPMCPGGFLPKSCPKKFAECQLS
jgi:hypothetical protein